MRGGAHNVMHPDRIEYYKNHGEPKVSYEVFARRIRSGYEDRELAITDPLHEKRRRDRNIGKDGRVCNRCKVWKPRSEFCYNKYEGSKMHSKCKECIKEYKREYRENGGRLKDLEYKRKRRHLDIGERIALEKARVIDGIPREDIYEVVEYRYKKGYLCRSIIDGKYINLDTGDNKNKMKFYRLNK